jgi:hypothetical protein
MIDSPDLSPDSISIFSAATRPITTGRRSAMLPAATTTKGCSGSSSSAAMAETSSALDRCSASDFDRDLRSRLELGGLLERANHFDRLYSALIFLRLDLPPP